MDAIFKALNDPTRRDLLDRLRQTDGQTLQQLETGTGMTRFGVMKHLKVLESAQLVVSRKAGRFKYHYLNAVPLQEVIDRWIEPLLKPAARSLIDLKAHLEGTTMSKPDFVMSTYIHCTRGALWDALREPDLIARYQFLGRKVERSGDTIRHIEPNGQASLVMVELEADPKQRLVMSFKPAWEAKPSRVVYLIDEYDGNCKLTVEHHDLTQPIEVGKGTEDAWRRTLDGLKSSLESGQSVRFSPDPATIPA